MTIFSIRVTTILFGASLSEPRIHEVQEAVLYVYIYICLWGDHFSEERVKFLTRKVMVVMRMRIRLHCTIDLRDNSSVGKA